MTVDIYRQLQQHLDNIGIGFPVTESGVEIKLLKTLFTEEDAAMFLNMSELPETPREVAERIGKDIFIPPLPQLTGAFGAALYARET